MFPAPNKIENLMDNFYLWLKENKNMHPVLLATEAHYRLVSIHPFIDGNGRCARLLMNLILIQNGYPPAIIKMTKRKEYIQSIQNADKNSMDEFYNLITDAELESLELYLDTVKNNIIWK
jgi:Fic family protein